VIGDINDFEDEGKLAAYFGIVPRISNSNETEHSGRITKRGSKLGRTALVQCALIAQRYSPYWKRYYEKIKARRGTGKAIIALARKLLGIIYRTLKNKWVFEDFHLAGLSATLPRASQSQSPDQRQRLQHRYVDLDDLPGLHEINGRGDSGRNSAQCRPVIRR
jgi:transposase